MIAKGCTCKNTFSIPFTKDEVEKIFITYWQNGKTVFEKEACDCSFEDGFVSVILGQEDTLKLKCGVCVKIQLRVKLADGTVTKSKIIETCTDEVLKNEVI